MLTRPLSILLAAALLLASPGTGGQRALAAVLTAPAAPASVIPVAGMQTGAFAGLGAQGALLGAGNASLRSDPGLGTAGLPTIPQLSPETRSALAVPAVQGAPVAGVSASAAGRLQAVSLSAQGISALPGAEASPLAAAVVSPKAAAGAVRLQEAAPSLRSDRSGLQGLGALSSLFDGVRNRSSAVTEPVRIDGAAARSSALDRPAPPQAGVRPELPEPGQPQRKLSRSFKIGIVGAALTLTISIVLPTIAAALGWMPHSNYAAPGLGAAPALADAIKLAVGATVMAPIAEEAIFRGGVLGGITRVLSKGSKSSLATVWLPAILSSLVFAAVHETGDPVLFATRAIASMVYARVYQKEGIHASIALHGFNNAFAIASTVGYAMSGAAGATLAGLAVAGAGILFLVRSLRSLARDREDRKSGRIEPYPLNRNSALVLMAILVLGVFLTPISDFASALWLVAATGYSVFSVVKGRQAGAVGRA